MRTCAKKKDIGDGKKVFTMNGARPNAATAWYATARPVKPIDMAKVKEGRKEELDYMQKMHVWDRVPRSEVAQNGQGKIVGTRWVYVDKGDKVRCRLVAQEFAGSD